MYKQKLVLSSLLILLYSCGGGGAAPFSFQVGQLQPIIIDEDIPTSGSFSASTNYTSTITSNISDSPKNGNVALNRTSFTYTPSSNFFGEDDFTITFTATQKDENGQTVGTPLTETRTIEITINPVNDSPTIEIFDDFTGYDETTLIVDNTLQISALISDVDNNINELNIYGQISNDIISGGYTEPVVGNRGDLYLQMSDVNKAGFQEISFCVSDGSLSQCANGFSAYFIADKQQIDIEHSCDGDGENCSSDKHYLYYLIGNDSDSAETDYVFIGDRLTNENIDSFRSAVLQSISTLTNSDAGLLIDGFFSVAIIEEVGLTELSAFEIEAGCYPNTPTVYCIGDVSRARIRNAFDYDVAAFISSLSGRGVAQGDINIQQLSTRTDEVVMHELGHSHGYMGDEYNSGSEYGEDLPRADTYINTTSVTDPDIVKWKHFIDDINNVPGFDYDICYNYSNGDIYLRDQVGNGTYQDCECFWNQWQDTDPDGADQFGISNYSTTIDPNYLGTNTDNSCKIKAGLIPGTYYSETDTFRPLYWTVMESGSYMGYGKINLEGFAFGSIMNQGFGDFSINDNSGTEGLTSSSALENNSLNITVNAIFDSEKLRLKWFKDGVEQTQLENNTSVSFVRPGDNSKVTYSWIVEDLSGTVIAPNDIENPIDFYEGWFESYYYYESDSSEIPYAAQQPYVGSWRWYSSQDGYLLDNEVSTNQDYMFAEICCSMGAAIKIDWSKYSQSSSTSNNTNNKRNKSNIFMSPSPNKKEKVLSLDLTKQSIIINKYEVKQPNKKDIRRPFIKKTDKYVVNFYDNENQLIYQLGIGNPFEIKIQHIGYVDKHNHDHDHNEFIFEDSRVSNVKLVIPSNINPQFISLSKRAINNSFEEISRIPIN
jgi:hypothetical protein